MGILAHRYRFLRHVALAGSNEHLPFGVCLAKYKWTLFKDYGYSNTERYLVYIDRRLNKIIHPDEPTLVQYLEEQLDRLEQYARERYIKRFRSHMQENLERLDAFLLEKFDIHCDAYLHMKLKYDQCRERFLYYHEYYTVHLHDYYLNSIYNPFLYAKSFSDHYLAIVEPYARPYINNPSVNFFLILLAFMCRMSDLLPLPWENEPPDLSISDFKLFSFKSTKELKWWQQIAFNMSKSCEMYGDYVRYQQNL